MIQPLFEWCTCRFGDRRFGVFYLVVLKMLLFVINLNFRNSFLIQGTACSPVTTLNVSRRVMNFSFILWFYKFSYFHIICSLKSSSVNSKESNLYWCFGKEKSSCTVKGFKIEISFSEEKQTNDTNKLLSRHIFEMND